MKSPELTAEIIELSSKYDCFIECGTGENSITLDINSHFDLVFSIEIASNLYYKSVQPLLNKGIMPLYGNCSIHLNTLLPQVMYGYILFVDIGDNIIDLRKTLESVLRTKMKKDEKMCIIIRGMGDNGFYSYEKVSSLIKAIFPKGFDMNSKVMDEQPVSIFKCL